MVSNTHSLLSATHWQQYLVLLTAAIFIWFAYRVVYQVFLSPLSSFPGPFWAKLTDLWHVAVILFAQEHTAIYALHQRHGPIVRIGPNKLYVTTIV